MAFPITSVFSFLKFLGSALSKLFLGAFLMKQGAKNQKLKTSKKDLKNAKKAGIRKSRIRSKSKSDKRSSLLKSDD